MKFNSVLCPRTVLALAWLPVAVLGDCSDILAAEILPAPALNSQSRPITAQTQPVEATTIPVMGVELKFTDTGLDIVLETASDRTLTIDPSQFTTEGTTLVANLPNARLALPDREEFQTEAPTPDIRRIRIWQLNASTLQIRVEGNGALPRSEVAIAIGDLIYGLNPQDAALEEEEITVTGTRSPRPVRLTPGSIAIIDQQDIDQQLVRDLRDAFRYEPNVSVGNDRRYGLQDINIRGLGGNRVLILNDGIRVPNQFLFGTPALGRDYVDLESLQRIEVIRGPASALYGSDALGGVVTFRTLEPRDVLDRIPGQSVVTSLSANVESVDRSTVFTGIVAFREGSLEGLLGYTRRDGVESQVPTGNEFVDPRYNARNNWLGKLVYRLSETSQIGFTTEVFRNEDDFRVAPLTAASLVGPTGFQGQNETLDNNVARDRFSLLYLYNDPNSLGWLNQARLQIYYQNAQVTELRTQDFVRTGVGSDRRRLRNLRNTFLDRTIGGEIQLQSRFNLGTVSNQLTYGLDIATTRNERVRDGIETRLNAAGATLLTTNVVGADNFPVKDFPDSDTFRLGIYLQNEIAFDNTITLIPGLRFDAYRLDTQVDALYLRNPGATAANFSDSALSPSLGVVWQAAPEWTVLGRYARGFRTPLYSEINAGFSNLTNPGFRYQTLSNPNLRPETSDTFEIGVRANYRQLNLNLTGFYNSYDNFIESLAPAGVSLTIVPGAPVSLFQSQNIARARTYGFELGGEYRFNPQPDGFSLLAGLGLTVGDNLTTHQPLESVDPFKAVVGLRYRAPEDLWGAELVATFVGQPRLRDQRPAGSYTPQGYKVLDLIGYYNITPLLTFNLGVFNLLNDQYFLYPDVRPLINSPTPGDIARFAQPGLSLRAGLTWRF